jgi:D-alanyl-D-alanine carboxypeptidase
LSLAVVKDGTIVKAAGYGDADVEQKVAATPDTLYELGSITKQFTAEAVLMLVEEGKLALDDKVSSILADLPDAWGDVTVQHLLTHTSGIKSYTSVGDFNKMARSDFKPGEILKLVATAPLEFKPGESWAYCNTGYYLLGLIIEKKSGKTYGEFLDERIFKPLGMSVTRPNDPRAILPHRAHGYARMGDRIENRDGLTPTSAFSAGNLMSTVKDMAKWAIALDEGKLLSSSSYSQMYTPVKLKNGESRPYGFGWGLGDVKKHKKVSHGGGTAGFSTSIARFPDDHVAVIVLTNLAGADADLSREIVGQYVPELAKKNVARAEDPDSTKKHRAVMTAILADKVDPDQFTDAFAKFLGSEPAKAMTKALNNLGELKEFQYLEAEEDGGAIIYRYKLKIGERALIAVIQNVVGGKIAGLQLKPE